MSADDDEQPPSPTGIDTHVGTQLQIQRVASGFSVEEASLKIKVSQSTLLLWEGGQERPTPEALFGLADLYACSIAELFESYEGGRTRREGPDAETDQINRILGRGRPHPEN